VGKLSYKIKNYDNQKKINAYLSKNYANINIKENLCL